MSHFNADSDEMKVLEIFQELNKNKDDPDKMTTDEMSDIAVTMTNRMRHFKEIKEPTYGTLFSFTDRDCFMNLLPIRMIGVLSHGIHGRVISTQSLYAPTLHFAAKEFVYKGLLLSNAEQSKKHWDKFIREASMLQQLDHKYIVKHKLSFTSPAHSVIFMEHCHFGAIFNHLSKVGVKQSKQWFFQMAKAVRYLHQNRIVHRNISLENILVRNNKTVAVSGFGVCERLEKGHNLVKGKAGSPGFIAPEVEAADDQTFVDGFKADAFSLGISLMCMLSEADDDCDDVVDQLEAWTSEIPRSLQDPCLNLCLTRLMKDDPNVRGDVTVMLNEVLSHWPDVGHI